MLLEKAALIFRGGCIEVFGVDVANECGHLVSNKKAKIINLEK